MESARRLQQVKEYYFSQKLKEIKARNAKGENIINLGIGSPDLPPPKSVIQVLKEASEEPLANHYQPYTGTEQLREAMSVWYRTHFKVVLEPSTEVLPLMGSKEGITHISLALLNKGDKVLVPNPGYPTYTSVSHLAEAEIEMYNLTEDSHWQPDLTEIKTLELDKVKLMWVNYPHMPTGGRADRKVMEELIQIAIENNFVIVNDNPYSFILQEDRFSILQLKDAKKCCLEMNSLSKSHNMAGWRVGMLLGASNFISEVLKVKSNVDSGMYWPIQKAAVEALQQGEEWFEKLNEAYTRRRQLVWDICDKLELKYTTDTGGMFVWAKVPRELIAVEWVEEILNEKAVFITPGMIFGTNGQSYVRFSLCATEEVLEEVKRRLMQ